MPKDRGTGQGDVDGPLECSLALGLVAAETRMCVATEQAVGSLPWIGVTDDVELQRLRADHATRLQESANFQFGGPEKLTAAHDTQHALQKKGGPADLWYMDDCDIMCHPVLVPTYLREFDVDNAKSRSGAGTLFLRVPAEGPRRSRSNDTVRHRPRACCRAPPPPSPPPSPYIGHVTARRQDTSRARFQVVQPFVGDLRVAQVLDPCHLLPSTFGEECVLQTPDESDQ